MKTSITLTAFALSLSVFSSAQQTEFKVPEKLSANINSSAEEVMPLLTADGNTMYYVRAFHEANTGGENTGHDIWKSTKTKAGTWEAATNVTNLNNEFSNGVIGMSGDGNRLYLMNSYEPGKETNPALSVSHKTESGWSAPMTMEIPGLAPTTRLYGFYISPDEQVMLISMEDGSSFGKEDLYVSVNDPMLGWTTPINLGPSINGEGFEISPFLSADNTTLYFASDRSGGHGDADIWMAKRQGNSWTSWSTPENLGSRINSGAFDAYFTILADSTVYFASSREGDLSDIYRSKLETRPVPVLVKKNTIGDRPSYIFFEFDKSNLTASSKDVLKRVGDTLDMYDEYKVVLEGHADHIGTDQYNIGLSQRRANSAQTYLQTLGISGDRMSTVAKGESEPMAPNTTADGSDNPEGRALNRRVVIRIVKPALAETTDLEGELIE